MASVPVIYKLLDESVARPELTDLSDTLDLISPHRVELAPGDRALVGMGLSLKFPLGHVGLIVPSPTLAVDHGVTVVDAPSVLTAEHRGEVLVALINLSWEQFVVEPGTQIARLVLVPTDRASFFGAESMSEL